MSFKEMDYKRFCGRDSFFAELWKIGVMEKGMVGDRVVFI